MALQGYVHEDTIYKLFFHGHVTIASPACEGTLSSRYLSSLMEDIIVLTSMSAEVASLHSIVQTLITLRIDYDEYYNRCKYQNTDGDAATDCCRFILTRGRSIQV